MGRGPAARAPPPGHRWPAKGQRGHAGQVPEAARGCIRRRKPRIRLAGDPTDVPEFVALYIAEGYKRCRNVVSIANSDDRVILLADSWLRCLSTKVLRYSIQYHADQDLDELCAHWGELLEMDGGAIQFQRKSNSGQMKGRSWRSQFGVLTIWAGDTLLRARLQAWIDRLKDEWRLHSATMRGA
jgi:hypothetical protein